MGSGNVSEIYICSLIVYLTPLANAACRTAEEKSSAPNECASPWGTSGGQFEEKWNPMQADKTEGERKETKSRESLRQ